jgi:hypothetical protein
MVVIYTFLKNWGRGGYPWCAEKNNIQILELGLKYLSKTVSGRSRGGLTLIVQKKIYGKEPLNLYGIAKKVSQGGIGRTKIRLEEHVVCVQEGAILMSE